MQISIRRFFPLLIPFSLLLAGASAVSGQGAPGVPGQGSPGVSFPAKPGQKDFFADEAGLIGPAERQSVNEIAGRLLAEQKVPIFVVTIGSLASHGAAGYTIERYAYELFNNWGIGSHQRNYGMLLIVSRDDRRARIELGSDWGYSHNEGAKQEMDTVVTPEFRRGTFSGGILAGVRGLDALARGLALPQLPQPKQPWWVLPLMLGGFALIIGVIVNLFKTGRSGWGWALIAGLGVLIFMILRGMASSRGSGGGFGGGSSGGGGASGSW